MIVLDTSATIEWALETRLGGRIQDRLFSGSSTLHAPCLLDLEYTQVIRRMVLAGRLSLSRGEQAIQDFQEFDIHRHPHKLLLGRIWELRENFNAYDACFVALAEALHAPLVTCDTKLSAGKHFVRVEVFQL